MPDCKKSAIKITSTSPCNYTDSILVWVSVCIVAFS